MHPIVNRETCSGCANCVEICPNEVYVLEQDKSDPARPEDCIECWACVKQCPSESICLCED
jgi:NAD-dependent dihydropyrimidine dehydrogenase PreA subunit